MCQVQIFQIHNIVQDATDEQLSGPVKLVVDESLPKLLGGQSSLDNFNRDYLTRHKDSISHLLTGQHIVMLQSKLKTNFPLIDFSIT